MIVTKDLIIINFPKTGSTFVREVMKKIHSHSLINKLLRFNEKYRYQVLMLPQIRTFNKRYNKPTEHGLYSQIDAELLKNKQVVSVKRNLFDYFISLYLYGDWKKSEALNFNEDKIRQSFSEFPRLTFEEYIKFNYQYPFYFNNPQLKNPKKIQNLLGPASVQFVFFYFKKTFEFLNNLEKYDLQNLDYSKLMPSITFLNQENLNRELYKLLSKYYPEKKIKFILKEEKKNVSNSNKMSVNDIKKETKELIIKNETLVINYFKDLYV